jgi:hypothetical protein
VRTVETGNGIPGSGCSTFDASSDGTPKRS